MKLIPVTIYADTTGWFDNSRLMNNMIDVKFPQEIVKQYYEENCDALNYAGFEDWYENHYTADDTDKLFDFSVSHGYTPPKPAYEIYDVEFTYTVSVVARSEDEAVDLATKEASAYISTRDHAIYVDGDYWG